jgi:hypothetical protein
LPNAFNQRIETIKIDRWRSKPDIRQMKPNGYEFSDHHFRESIQPHCSFGRKAEALTETQNLITAILQMDEPKAKLKYLRGKFETTLFAFEGHLEEKQETAIASCREFLSAEIKKIK